MLIGRQGEEVITAQELAELAGTIQNEIITSLSARVVRLYLRSGMPVSMSAITQKQE